MGKWFNENYIYRYPIAIDFSGVGATPATFDVEVDVPSDWDLFWDNILSNFFDVVVTDATGNVINFQRKAGANYANRILQLEIDSVVVPEARSIRQFFLYFGYSSETVDRSVSITVTTPKDGYIFLGSPLNRIVSPSSISPAATTPITTFIKSTEEELDIFFSIQGILEPRRDAYNGQLRYEEIDFVTLQSLDSSGTNSDTRYDLVETRFLAGFIKARAKAGSNNTDYSFGVLISTTEKQIYDIRCLIKTKDLLPN